ncbi:MAG: hypothetical protein HOP10_11185 [Chitinophagaceae bacterium]|nr:hypothetical protein [Chitinophagaceae bacterium]
MLKFLTSLTFLYSFTIVLLLLYGWVYYKSFAKNRYQKRRFPYVFLLISAACFAFLYFNIHAPLSLKTFSNLDHHFIRHDGFRVANNIELGRTDTSNYKNSLYNSFKLGKKNNQLSITSSYSEEPFFIQSGNTNKLLSANYAAAGHSVSFQLDSFKVNLKTTADSSFELSINNSLVFNTGKTIKKGISAWNIFKDETSFINSPWYTAEKLMNALKQVLLLQDKANEKRELKYFLSGRLFRYAGIVQYDGKEIQPQQIAFSAIIPDKTSITWGISIAENNKNHFRVNYLGADSFALLNRYPVSYPLAEEDRSDWTKHSVNKFLVADQKDMVNMPAVFGEGFLFPAMGEDSAIGFSPVLLSYGKNKSNAALAMQAKYLNGQSAIATVSNNMLLLPARTPGIHWLFSIQNSFNWKLGSRTLAAGTWQLFVFGVLGFFFLLVFASSWLRRADKLSWVWQLLSCITIVLLTTRLFLYWRYKSFPPYEGMDLPSMQQLNSFWNFGIIIITGSLLGIIIGFSFLKYLYTSFRKRIASLFNKHYSPSYDDDDIVKEEKISGVIDRLRITRKRGVRMVFFLAWILVLIGAGALAVITHFDPAVCRHLALALVLIYFVFIYISYKFSPLVASAEKKWWDISTGKSLDIIINNPVKVLLSVNLLALFAFVDIGFAIIFLNFLLFNEAFLCINYAIAGLSAGSKRNASLFGLFGFIYLLLFAVNLMYGPYIFRYLLELPGTLYITGYLLFAIAISYVIVRLLFYQSAKRRALSGVASALFLFGAAFLFFPKERILDKATMTKYRIDVMAMPVDKAIEQAYEEGKTYEPVIRAAQNQWFINAFIYEKNNPSVTKAGFNLLPHAPQNKGARYNAQATDLVASRFFIAEHGKWSVLLYVLLLLIPTTLLASFYKLYPDFTNRVNNNYPTITAGFSLLNYLLITALLVILAATGRYIFFGQDLPFGSILSKQSILFPSVLIIIIILLFKRIPLEQYPNRKKMIPGAIVFTGLGLLLFLAKPAYNKEKEFRVADLAKNMDSYIQLRLQPVMDHFDTSKATRKLSLAKKDKLFTDSVHHLLNSGYINDAGKFFFKQIESYLRNGFTAHLDQRRMLYLDIYSGRPQLAVNDNYFRVEPPPHLQQYWAGNVFSDTSNYNITFWSKTNNSVLEKRMSSYTDQPTTLLSDGLQLGFKRKYAENLYEQLCLINISDRIFQLNSAGRMTSLSPKDTLLLNNPDRIRINDDAGNEKLLVIQPDAFMKNYFVNGSRFYVYPMSNDFIWARNFAESISSEYTARGEIRQNAFISVDAEITDSLSVKIKAMLGKDTSYKRGAEYGICIADGNGRLIAMNDHIKEMARPDPNDKIGFNRVIQGEGGFVSQSLLRKQIGNINLLRLNPGPGSTLKPIVFSAIASQMNMDWDAFAAEGFSEKQEFFGGEKVGEYDFEKNNGRINNVVDYLRYSDNYYHSNLLLLGSYSKQSLADLLSRHFATQNPANGFHWPYFNYHGKQYWLNGFENWPGYINGKVNFGSDSSFISVGLFNNYSISTYPASRSYDKFSSGYDSSLLRNAYKKSGFILPEYALFDQKGTGMNHARPNEMFLSSFRGHVKGSSQVMMPPVKMLDAFGKLVSQSRNYSLTLNPYAKEKEFTPFYTDNGVIYSNYLSIVREKVFEGMKQSLFSGTAARLGRMLKDGAPYYYYAKTGTTGDNDEKAKSKLFVIIISSKKLTDPDFNFRKNKFITIYFTSQNGPAKQNEEFQAEVIKYVQQSSAFKKYMGE